ncbi:Uncharacterised protein [Acinetobacter baumannii]|nr:Uncharacterised protein [Acinetobacter baumannii]
MVAETSISLFLKVTVFIIFLQEKNYLDETNIPLVIHYDNPL